MRIKAFLLLFIMVITSILSPSVSTSAAVRRSQTVAKANSYNYLKNTVSQSGSLLTPNDVSSRLAAYGKYGNAFGMPVGQYKTSMKYRWANATPSSTKKAKAKEVDIDLTKQYRYKELVQIQQDFAAKYDGVFLYKIGASEQRRNIYALEVDLSTCKASEKKTILLTGQVHARETAGPAYILKELIDFVKAYYAGDARTVEAAKNVRFVAVACVNPDAHDGIGFDIKNWTYSDGIMWKANANGVDLNRNYPGLSWMMTAKGLEKTKYSSNSPTQIYYPGPYAGSELETQAMMKFYQYFIGVEGAEMLIDYHQQGRISYAGKGYATAEMNELSESLRKALYQTQKGGILGKSYGRCDAADEDTARSYGRVGAGSTNTDYAWAVALGAKFSTQYGFSVYVDKNGGEHTILEVPRRDETALDLEPIKVPTFRSFSWEIGYGVDYLGYSESTLKLLEKEYYNYNFDEMLYTYIEQVNK